MKVKMNLYPINKIILSFIFLTFFNILFSLNACIINYFLYICIVGDGHRIKITSKIFKDGKFSFRILRVRK